MDAGRDLGIDGLVNARDLGGLPRAGGAATPSGIFLRSASVDGVTDQGWQDLHARGVRTVVDLRQDAERARDTGPRPQWLTTLHVDHDGLEDTVFWADYWDDGRVGTALYYEAHLKAMPERTVAALRAVATAPPGGVLFHCAAGRDRTGLIAALLLTVADVDEEAVVTDYLLARRCAPGHDRAAEEAKSEAVCARFGTTIEGAFRGALATLDLREILTGLSPDVHAVVTTWRGALEPTCPIS